MTTSQAHGPADHHHDGSIKETLISLIISFTMAMIFRSYVVEAFIIPTGSMAPTLLGAHMQFRSPQSGVAWAVNPWYEAAPDTPAPIQGRGAYGEPTATDPASTSRVNSLAMGGRVPPVSGYAIPPAPMPIRAGDRILVQKYLYEVFPPKRYDVVVFKNPELPAQNFIKRLVGLPGEQIWIAGGDIFARRVTTGPNGHELLDEWAIRRKPRRVQEAVWRLVYSSEFAPLEPARDGRQWFEPPWRGEGWSGLDSREYRHESGDRAALEWDTARWPVWDWVAYNEWPNKVQGQGASHNFPVSDVRVRAGVRPDRDGLTVLANISARGHEFQARIDGQQAEVRMRRIIPASPDGAAWVSLAREAFPGLPAGRVSNLEFRHVDQALDLWLNGRSIVRGEYGWGPSERLLHATGRSGDEYEQETTTRTALREPEAFAPDRPRVSWSFSGSPVTLFRVGLDRDLYYESVQMGPEPGLGTHPSHLATLGPDQFFVLGDNSPASKDGRLWDRVDPWVQEEIDPTVGVVPRRLMLGKAFFVYFPAPFSLGGRIPIPDFGRLRAIR